MQESLVKLLLIVVGVIALALGVIFLFFPTAFLTFAEADAANVGWLRSVGGGLVVFQGFGLLVASFRRRDTNLLLASVAFASVLQSIGIWISVFKAEYTATASWTTIVLGILASLAAVLLVGAWWSRRRTVADLPARLPRTTGGEAATHSAPAASRDDAGATVDTTSE
jgi:hypothetical protein